MFISITRSGLIDLGFVMADLVSMGFMSAAKDIAVNSGRQAAQSITKEAVKSVPEDVAKEMMEDLSKNLSEGMVEAIVDKSVQVRF